MNNYLRLLLALYLHYELLIAAILVVNLWNNIHSCQEKVILFAFVRNLEVHVACFSPWDPYSY